MPFGAPPPREILEQMPMLEAYEHPGDGPEAAIGE